MRRRKEYRLVSCREYRELSGWRKGLACVLALSLVGGSLCFMAGQSYVSAAETGAAENVLAAESRAVINFTGGQGGSVGNDRESAAVVVKNINDGSRPESTVSGNDTNSEEIAQKGEMDEVIHGLLAQKIESEFPDKTHQVKERGDILVFLDPGHGGEDEGCSRGKVLEKELNLQIAKVVEARLKEAGYRVRLTRETDEAVILEQRTAMANRAEADIYISIHQNACEEPSSGVSGIETWYNEEKAETGSRRLAQLVHRDVILYSKALDRRTVADDRLTVIKDTDMPACLVETGFLSNREERARLCTEEYQDRIAEGIVSGIELYFFPKTMYLTFDDGPSARNTEAVLDILKKYDIKATFFMIGEYVERYPEIAKRVVSEGHAIGVHCYDHDYGKLYANVDSYVSDFEKAHEVIYEVTGVDTKLFRFPGGSVNSYNKAVRKDIIREMTDRGYIYFDWNASIEDATKHNEPEKLLKNARESTLGRRRVVMLAHDRVYNTTLCLEELIALFPEYRMEKLTEDVEPVQF